MPICEDILTYYPPELLAAHGIGQNAEFRRTDPPSKI